MRLADCSRRRRPGGGARLVVRMRVGDGRVHLAPSGHVEIRDIMDKRSEQLPVDEVQQGNRQWWTRNTMSYDWHNEISAPRFSAGWFDAIDRRFIDSARLYGTDQQPFDRVIPFSRIAGARVVEIGWGRGRHPGRMVRGGADGACRR